MVRRPRVKREKVEKRTAQNRAALFVPQVEVLDQIDIGDTKLRFVQTLTKKTKSIEIWHYMSQEWGTLYRYHAEEQWESWKKYADLYNEKQRNRRGADDVAKPIRKRRVSTKQPDVATDVISPKDSGGDRARAVKDERRVERPPEEHQKRVRKRKQD